MTPTPDKRRSGNPAVQAEIAQTARQRREQEKQRKLAEYQRELSQRRRSKLVWWTVGGAAGLIVVALVAASFVFAPQPAPAYTAGGEGDAIEGVQEYENTTTHVEGTVEYPQTPPTGGPHNAMWLNCGIYSEPQPDENAVHSLEHGAVWITYDATAVTGDQVTALRALLPSTYALLSPYEGMDSPIVISAWNRQLKVDSASDPRLPRFIEEYWRNQSVPEPNALCTGALDGPGKQ